MIKTLQAKHVDEVAVLRFLDGLDQWATHKTSGPCDPRLFQMPSIGDLPEMAVIPEKVLRAKLAAMKRRGLIGGCECGCRGDWVILDAGREALARTP